MNTFLTIGIVNNGPVITRTSYWDSLYNKQGIIYLSVNCRNDRQILTERKAPCGAEEEREERK
jgi:hypothetical protein